MVYFVCEGCNETLKKNQVDKHASRCRSCHAVTCVDCSVTFYGQDFEGHTVCISEAEKYEGALYKAKKVTKMNPQELWMSVVEEAANDASSAALSIQPFLSRLCDFGNVPRNQKKFTNFVKNSLKVYNDKVIDQIWEHLGKAQKERTGKFEHSTLDNASSSVEVATLPAGDDMEKLAKKERKKALKRARESSDDTEEKTQPTSDEVALEKLEKKKRKKERKMQREEAEAN